MDLQKSKYNQQLQKNIKFLCGKTIQAYIDSNMLMHPEAYKYKNKNTFMFRYTFYAFRQRAILAVRKLIEPTKKNKITIQTLVNIATKEDYTFLSEQEKNNLKEDYNALFHSEEVKRIKDFRDSFCHNIADNDNVVMYYKDIMTTINDIMYILEELYLKLYGHPTSCFVEARNLAKYLSLNYWKALDDAALKSNNNNNANNRLEQLINGNI